MFNHRQIAAVARSECRLQLRDGRLRLAALGLMLVILTALVSGGLSYRDDRAAQQAFTQAARAQWLDQGEKHPHRAAHFGLYVTKPEMPLAIFDPGLKAAVGQALWLEAHDRPIFSYAPMDEDVYAALGFGLSTAAGMVQSLVVLLLLVWVAPTVAREREDGTLKQVLAQGIAKRNWVLGKWLGNAALLGLLLLPLALLLLASAWFLSDANTSRDNLTRALVLTAVYGVYLLIFLSLALALSLVARNARAALLAALAVWILSCVLAPRLASSLALNLAPAPTYAALKAQMDKDFIQGIEGKPGWDERLAQLEQEALQRYGVEHLSELPVGFSGLRMLRMDDWNNALSDYHFGRLAATYERQEHWRMLAGLLGPMLSLQSLSRTLAGMDWRHYSHFADAAEDYRRHLGQVMNQVMADQLRGDTWEMTAGRETWEQVDAFRYSSPGWVWALIQRPLAWTALIGWLVAAGAALGWATRRMRV